MDIDLLGRRFYLFLLIRKYPFHITSQGRNTTMTNPKLKLLNMFDQGQPVMSTFMAMRGMRLAQIVANTGLDVRNISPM